MGYFENAQRHRMYVAKGLLTDFGLRIRDYVMILWNTTPLRSCAKRN
jgi:hypothetical protein